MADLLLRYYAGHEGSFGLEYLEFAVYSGGQIVYKNDSRYKQETVIERSCVVRPIVIEYIVDLIRRSKILHQPREGWPQPGKNGCHELEIRLEGARTRFVTCELGSRSDVLSRNVGGLLEFYVFSSEIKSLVLNVVGAHFYSRPV